MILDGVVNLKPCTVRAGRAGRAGTVMLVAMLSTTGCSGTAARSPSPSTAASAECSKPSDGRLLGSTVTRVLTDAVVVQVDASGAGEESPAPGMPGPLTPSTTPADSAVAPQSLVALLPGDESDYGFGPSPGLEAHGWQEALEGVPLPAKIVWFAGVDRVDARAEFACGAAQAPLSVAFVTWTLPAFGVLECGTQPPAESTAALALPLCSAG